jgi:hypothetical protein
MEKCNTCKFFVIAYTNANTGYCRRYPPNIGGEYSRCRPYDWCGEYKEKESSAGTSEKIEIDYVK